MPNNSVGAFTALQTPIIDQRTGGLSYTWQKQFQQWQSILANGFDPSGNLTANISPNARIVGRGGTIGSILGHISDTGVIDSAGMASATHTEQGAVVMPAGASTNILGTAAIEPATAFDPAGAAAAAQTGAQSFATTAANNAEANAVATASDAANITSGLLNLARIPGITVTIVTAQLTPTGTQGSMDFTNGVLTAQTPAT